MKVVYSTDNYWPRISGMGVSIDSFRTALESLGHTVFVFAPRYPPANPAATEMNDENVFRFDAYPLLFTRSPEDRMVYPWKRREVWAALDSLAPDVIHPQTEFPLARMTWEYAIRKKVPLAITCHTYFEQYINLYFPWLPHGPARAYARDRARRTYDRAQVVIVPSHQMASVLRSYGVTRPVEVIPTGIDAAEFSGVDRREEKASSFLYREHPDLRAKRILFTAGRVGKEKNIDFLVEVMSRLSPEIPDVVLLIAGGGPYEEELASIIVERKLEKSIRMLGYVPRPLMKHCYSLADVFVFASKTETQGLVTVEAMSCGTPVVAVGVMGTRDVMGGDHGGFMTGDDVDEFTAKIRWLLTDHELHAARSREASAYAAGWTNDRSARRMIEVYGSIV